MLIWGWAHVSRLSATPFCSVLEDLSGPFIYYSLCHLFPIVQFQSIGIFGLKGIQLMLLSFNSLHFNISIFPDTFAVYIF
jgi:hypothetical protein